MSKKKGAASSRNGRDSNAQRLGVKVFERHACPPGRSSSASAARSSTPATTSAGAATTRCSPRADGMVKFGSRKGRKLVDVLPADSLPARLRPRRRSPALHRE